MQFDNQKTRNVADIAAKIMAGETVSEELKGNQHKIDANKNNKIDAHDFKLLRAKKKMKEESEQEETILEYESKEGVYRHKGTYGYEGKGAEHGQTDYKEKEKEEKPKKGYGARQNYVRSKKVSGKTYESFSDMMNQYKEQGIKGLFESMKKKATMKEETELTESHFKVGDEVVCKASGMEGEVVEVDPKEEGKYYTVKREDGTTMKYAPDELELEKEDDEEEMKEEVDLEERTLTEPEMKKKEEVVMSMKKKLSGFKDRYGDKAKSVMYATATKIAKKD